MNKTDDLIITVRTTVESMVEEEFNEWQFEEHVPWILSVVGYENVRRFKDVENEHRYVNIWGLTDFAGHDCDDHERKSKSPWGRRLKRYRKLKVDFYHKLACEGTLPLQGCDSLLLYRFNEKAGKDAIAVGKAAVQQFAALPFVDYAAFYEMDRGTAKHLLRVEFKIPEYASEPRVQELLRQLAADTEIDSKELYSAMADMSFPEQGI